MKNKKVKCIDKLENLKCKKSDNLTKTNWKQCEIQKILIENPKIFILPYYWNN